MDARPLLQVSVVLLAAGAAAYVGLLDDPAAVRDGVVAGSPDYLADGLAMTDVGGDGRILRQLSAQHLRHDTRPERFSLDAPTLTLFRDGQPTWRIRARRGDSSDPSRDIWLTGGVSATRDARLGPPLRLDTPRLHANPATNRLDTPARVVVTGPQSTLRAVGLNADLNAKTLELVSAVEVTHAPPR